MKECYECPRCGYQTNHKTNMRKHLYFIKNTCPTIKSMIELTDAVKDHILKYRRYLQETLSDKIINTNYNQIINNHNTIYNHVANMDCIEKLTKYMEYSKRNLVDFEDYIDTCMTAKVKRLRNAKHNVGLSPNDFLQLIDDISKIGKDDFEHMNLIYDNKYDKIKVYENGIWNEWLCVIGPGKIIEYLQLYYLNDYEKYLVIRNKRADIPLVNRIECLELLEKYYRFIGAFDIEPYIRGVNDGSILGNDDVSFKLEEEFYGLYQKTQDKTSKSDVNRIKKNVLDILKKNTSKSVDFLNKKVTEMFNMDEEFKKLMFHTVHCSL